VDLAVGQLALHHVDIHEAGSGTATVTSTIIRPTTLADSEKRGRLE